MNMPGFFLIAFWNGVKPRVGPENREPGRPGMGRDKQAIRRDVQDHLQEIFRRKPEDGPAVGTELAEFSQFGIYPLDHFEGGGEDQRMDPPPFPP